MLRNALAGLAAVVLLGTAFVPDDALAAYRRGSASASSFGGGTARNINARGGRYGMTGRGYGYRAAAYRGGYGYRGVGLAGAAAVGTAAAIGTAATVAATSPNWGWGWGGGPGYAGGAYAANAYYAPAAAAPSTGWYISGGGMACTPGMLIMGGDGLPFLCPTPSQ